MKKTKILSLFAAIIFFLLSSVQLSAIAEDEPQKSQETKKLLYSSNFESGTFENWSSFGNRSKLHINDTISHSGSICIFTSEREVSWSGPCLNLTDYVNPSSEIQIIGYVMSEEETTISFTVKVVDPYGTESFDSVGTVETVKGKWMEINGEYEVPADVSEIRVYAETVSGTADFSLDDVEVYGLPRNSAISGEDNGNYHFDFENSTEGWVPRGLMSLMYTNKFSMSGKYSLYSSDRTDFWNGPRVSLSRVVPGVDYAYSAYVMYNEKEYEDSHVFMMMLQYIHNGEEIYSVVSSKELKKGTWSKISGHFVLPADAADVMLYIQTEDVDKTDRPLDMNDLIPFYIDNVSVTDSTAENSQRNASRLVAVVLSVAGAMILSIITVLLYKRSRSRRAALRSARIDAMTGAYNRNAFESRVNELNNSPEKLKKIYITVCDVNFLKDINDNYGHETGDRAIIRCAMVLMKAAGKKNPVYRTGGDEFICLSERDVSKDMVTELTLEASKYKGYPFSVAIGAARYDKETDGDAPDFKRILARSDKEMYKNKEQIKKNFTKL